MVNARGFDAADPLALLAAQAKIYLVPQRLDPCKGSTGRNERNICLSRLDNNLATLRRRVDDRIEDRPQMRTACVLSRYQLIGCYRHLHLS